MITNDNWVLTVGTFLPLAGVLIMLFIPREEEALHKLIALLTAAGTLAMAIVTLCLFDYDHADKLQFFADHSWIDAIKSHYAIGVDGISLPLYVLSAFITF